MNYQQDAYQFLQETRREIDRLTQKIDSLKKVERLLDGMLSGSAPSDPVEKHHSGTRPEKSSEPDPTPPDISGLPLFSGARWSEKTDTSHEASSDHQSPHPSKETYSEKTATPIPKIFSEQSAHSDSSQGSTSWGELALAALKSSPHPMSLDELVSRVSKMEGCPSSSDPRNAIRVALTRRKDAVRRESRGFYQLVDG